MKNIVYTVPLYTSVKIIKNEVGCWDDTVPKTVETRRHCEVGLRAIFRNPQETSCREGVQKIVVWSQSYLTVPSIHPTSFLMIFTLVSLIFPSHKRGQDTLGSLA